MENYKKLFNENGIPIKILDNGKIPSYLICDILGLTILKEPEQISLICDKYEIELFTTKAEKIMWLIKEIIKIRNEEEALRESCLCRKCFKKKRDDIVKNLHSYSIQ